MKQAALIIIKQATSNQAASRLYLSGEVEETAVRIHDLLGGVLSAVEAKLLILDADPCVRLNRSGKEYVAADDGVFTDHGIASEYGSSGIDRDVILDSGVTLLVLELSSALC